MMSSSDFDREHRTQHPHVEPSVKPIVATVVVIVGAFLLMITIYLLATNFG